MTSVEAIEHEIKKLSASQLREFRRWFEKFEANTWDMQIEKDAANGKFDSLAQEALREYNEGKAQEI